jgi:16S rRNA (cytidine1402-2'-O)-methyltransferase
MSKLYIVATPIGNLEDITFRALRILKEVDLILCEDTRIAKKLLNFYNISTSVESYHQHSRTNKVERIKKLLKEKNLALISDSGTPGISDPGNKLINELMNDELMNDIEIIPVPGASAISAIASISGFPMDKFIFLGFPPHKKGRNKFFKKVAKYKYPVILYESPYRIIKTLKELANLYDFEAVIGRELTKKFETIYRGKIKEIIHQLAEKPKGEFVIVINL